MAKTNNSLSDLNNEEHDFNRMLNDNEISKLDNDNNNSVLSTDKENKSKIKDGLIQKSNSASNQDEKDSIGKLITSNDSKINQTDNPDFNNKLDTFTDINGNPLSLFDRSAFIDYGRFINSDGSVKANWQEYLKDRNGNFIINNKTKINTPVLFKDNSLDPQEGLTIPNLISWSEKYPALQLRFQDFVYCKRLGYYPNNRLVILRRFKGGIPDNLFDYFNRSSSKIQYTQPLATMITWLKPDEDIIDLSFNEEWEDYHLSFIETIKNAVNNFVGTTETGKGKDTSNPSEGFEDLITSLSLNATDLTKEDGVPFTRSSIGNPNLIKKSSKRKTGGEGLKSDITFRIKFEYELRMNNQIDPGIAMLDLISNSVRMGTSESEFKYNIGSLKNSDLVKSFVNGDISKATDLLINNIQKFTGDLEKNVSNIFNNIKTIANNTIGSQLSNDAANYIISRYREDLKAALSADTGLPSGIWHITIGNPKAPIISCGDLIIESSKLKLGKELGYNDFPNSFEVEYTLRTARQRGRNQIISVLNSGRGRLYVYGKASDNPDYDLQYKF